LHPQRVQHSSEPDGSESNPDWAPAGAESGLEEQSEASSASPYPYHDRAEGTYFRYE
jgi:hypothetical protein